MQEPANREAVTCESLGSGRPSEASRTQPQVYVMRESATERNGFHTSDRNRGRKRPRIDSVSASSLRLKTTPLDQPRPSPSLVPQLMVLEHFQTRYA